MEGGIVAALVEDAYGTDLFTEGKNLMALDALETEETVL